MITREGFNSFLATSSILILSILLPVTYSLERSKLRLTPYPITQKEGHGSKQLDDISGQKQSIPKFGDAPTNRVLPVDHLTEADYEDIQDQDIDSDRNGNGVVSRDDCSRWMRLEFMNALKSEKRRQARQEDDAEGTGLLENYLDFDPAKVVGPLLKIMGSAAARNVTQIDESYKQLPPFFKTQVTDFIQVFNALLTTVGP